ncbi:inorganic pyrophosphatase TTM2 [Trifolium repens]|nr:inorganic pyrophosphatase TTM2 [Trifolium repens]
MKIFHLLCAIPKSYENLKDALLYGKEGTITLDEVRSALRTNELTKFKDLKVDDGAKGLNVARGRSENGGKGKGKGPSLGQRVMVVASSNATIVRNRVTSRRIVLGEGAVVVRDDNLPIPSGYPQKIPTTGRVKTRILGTGMGMGNYPQN